MSSPFSLLRLPRLVLFKVFKSLDIGEKIKLSFCSERTSAQINDARLYSQKVIVGLDMINQEIRVHSENDEDTFDIFICPDFERTPSSNTQLVSIALTRYTPTISKLFDLQVKFKNLCIRPKDSENLLWNQISRNMELVERLVIMSIVDTGFRPVFTSWPQKISIRYSAWFTLESLLACPCTTIQLVQSHLENKDFDKIFKNWKAGGFPNLERLEIYSQNITNNGDHVLGMNWSDLDGMVIQTDDGSKKATIELGHCIKIAKEETVNFERETVIPTNEEDQTMIESHELLSMACVKYEEEKNARDKEPNLRYTTMQMSLIGHLCDVVRKELDELKRAEEQKKRIKN